MRRILNTLICLLLSTFPLFATAALPDLDNGQSSALPAAQDKAYGQKFITAIRQQLPLVHDLVVLDYVQNLGYLLASNSPRPNLHFAFFIVKTPQINAFAGPYGYIGINSGLILAANTEDELAAVMSHEIAHVTQRHIARGIAEQERLKWPTIGALIAAIAVGTQAPQAGVGAAAAVESASMQHALGYSRKFENEADRVGMQILKKSGFSSEGMTAFMRKLLAMHYPSKEDEVLASLNSHPEENMRVAETLTFDNPKTEKTQHHSEQYNLIRARLAVDTVSNLNGLLMHYEDLLKSPQHKNLETLQYAYSFALFKADQANEAEKVLQPLLKKYPQQLLFQMLQANILNALQKTEAADHLFKKLYAAQPDYFPLTMEYANFLLLNQQSSQALNVLDDFSDHDSNPAYLDLLARTQNANGDSADAAMTHAKILLLNGNKEAAKAVLEIAIRQTQSPITKARLTRMADRIKLKD